MTVADGERRKQKTQDKWLEVRAYMGNGKLPNGWMVARGVGGEILEDRGQQKLENWGTDLWEWAQSVKSWASRVKVIQRTSTTEDELNKQVGRAARVADINEPVSLTSLVQAQIACQRTRL